MLIGALDGRYPMMKMVRKWAVVYAGNAVGALLAVALLLASGFLSMQEGSVGELAYAVALSKASLGPVTAFARGVLCNVLVCLGVWMGSAGKTVCDKFAATILPVVSFVVLGFEHSVANMFFLPLGVAAQSMLGVGAIPLAGMASNLMFVTLGNIVGGAAVAAAHAGRRRDPASGHGIQPHVRHARQHCGWCGRGSRVLVRLRPRCARIGD